MKKVLIKKLKSLSIIGLTAVLAVAFVLVPPSVIADTISEQINSLQQQNSENRAAVASLKDQAVSYQDAITRLQSEINMLQGSIDDNKAKQADLKNQIEKNQQDLDRQKEILGENIRVMYVEGKITTVEMLLTSKDFSHFIDRQSYHNNLKNKIQDTVVKIQTLQEELTAQNIRVTALLKEQQAQQTQLDKNRQDQVAMLSYNKNQQAEFNAKTKENQTKINNLIEQQRRANRAGNNGSLIAGSSSYPYANYAFSMSPGGCGPGEGPDEWNYCTRQCVSYAAWAVAHSGRKAPYAYRSAYMWVQKALDNGVPVYSFSNPGGYSGVISGGPQPGDVAISTGGTWGHAMYIEGVSGKSIYVSQYNADLDGQFSYQTRDASNYYFLRFP